MEKLLFKFEFILRLVPLLAVMMLLACGGENDQQMVDRASDYVSQKKISEAVLELKSALKENPDNGEARFLLAKISGQVGDYASSEKEYRRAIQLGWHEEEAEIGKIQSMLEARKFEKALEDIDVKDSFSVQARASLLAQKAFSEAALGYAGLSNDSILKAITLAPNAYHVLKNAMQIKILENDFEAASQYLAKAIELFPDDSELMIFDALLKIQIQRDYNAAAGVFRKVIQNEPEKPVTVYSRKARLGLTKIEIQNKNLDVAELVLSPVLLQNAKDLEANYLGGLLAFEQAQFDLAEERLNTVIKVVPTHMQTQLLFGTVSYVQKKYEQAAYYLSKYINSVPENAGARKLLGRTYMKLGQLDEAKASLLYDNNGNDAELAALVGLTEMQAGDFISGVGGLERAVELAPDSRALRYELAKAYVASGDVEKAIDELEGMLGKGGSENQTELLLIAAYLRGGDSHKAIDVAMQRLQQAPEDHVALTLVGNVYSAAGDKEEAKKYLSKAIQKKPDFVTAKMSLADILQQEGHFGQAIELLKEISKDQPKLVSPLIALAQIAEKQGDSKAMYQSLEKARTQSPENIRVRAILAETYLRDKKIHEAEIVLKEGLALAPGELTFKMLMGRVKISQKQFNEAQTLLKEVVDKSPSSIYVRALLAEVYVNLKDYSNAKNHLDVILKVDPDFLPAIILLASIALEQGDFSQAVSLAERVVTINPELSDGYEILGQSLLKQGEYEKARVNYQMAFDRRQSARLAINTSNAAMYLKKYEDAAAPLRHWLDKNPDDAIARQFLGGVYMASGENKKAIKELEKVLSDMPDNTAALNNLAWLYSVAGNAKALPMAERAYKLAPRNSGILDTYGWILVQQGEYTKGRKIIEQALEVLHDNSDVQYHYAVALVKTGESHEAKSILSKILKADEQFEAREQAGKLYEELR